LACNTPEWTAIMHVYRSMRLICLVRTTETIVQLLLSGRSKVRQQYAKVNQCVILDKLCKGAATDSACNTLPIVLAEMLCVPLNGPMTRSCLRSVGEKQSVRRTQCGLHVRQVMGARSMLCLGSLPPACCSVSPRRSEVPQPSVEKRVIRNGSPRSGRQRKPLSFLRPTIEAETYPV
jgi:hypothetical protein